METIVTRPRVCGLSPVKLAAQQDEKNGFPFTAAMGWRKAAELFVLITSMFDLCWVEWERIMRLPRQLAGPISASNAEQSSSPTSDSCDRGINGTVAAVLSSSNTPPMISGFLSQRQPRRVWE